MKTAFPPNPPEEHEVRITALLQGELSADESAQVRNEIGRNPEMQRLHDRLQLTMSILKATLASTDRSVSMSVPRLSEDRRQRLLGHFKASPAVTSRETPKFRSHTAHRWRMPWYVPMSLAALVIGLLSVEGLLREAGGTHSRSEALGTYHEKSLAAPPLENSLEDFGQSGEAASADGATVALSLAEPSHEARGYFFQADRSGLPLGRTRSKQADGFVAPVGPAPAAAFRQLGEQLAPVSDSKDSIEKEGEALRKFREQTPPTRVRQADPFVSEAAPRKRSREIDGFPTKTPLAEIELESAANFDVKNAGQVRDKTAAGGRTSEAKLGRLSAKRQLAAPDPHVEPQRLNESVDEIAPIAPIARSPATEPQPEISTAENAFSTFSLNVSDVSFKLAAASLEKGILPELASIRSEEFINAFHYRDPEPVPGVPVGFTWERARNPFAQDRDILRFAVRTAAEGREAGHPLNIVLLLDNSGSMERADRVRIVREAVGVLGRLLHPQDRISVVTFSRTPRLWIDGLAGDHAGELADRVGTLTPEGGTNLEEALELGYRTASRHFLSRGGNRVVLLTDGAANLGDVRASTLKAKVEAWRRRGIALDCFGIGWEGLNDDLLEVLSRNGDGRYGFINSAEDASTGFADQLAGALRVAAADVKVQVEFNPQRVSVWRQIGYARHQLTKAQFRDNTVDAAELAAAESGNALYVVQTDAAGNGPIATVRVRHRDPVTGIYREQEWPVPYTGPAVAMERAPVGLRLASCAAAFSEWLAQSPYAAAATPDVLIRQLEGIPQAYAPDPTPLKLEAMLGQARSISRK